MAAPRPPAASARIPPRPLAPSPAARAARRGAVLAVLLLALSAAPPAVRPAAAAFLGEPVPGVEVHRLRHGLDLDYTSRKVTSSRWNSPLTMNNVRLVARETYGAFAWRDVLINVSGIFGVSRAEIDFGTVDMQDAGVFWETYAPGTAPVGDSRRSLVFGDTYGSSIGASMRGRFFYLGKLPVAAGAQILYSESADTGLPAMKLRYNEWDFFAGTSWEASYLSYYSGLDASFLVGELSLPDRATDLDQDAILGVFGGLRMEFYRHLVFAVELRLLNQSALSTQVVYRF